MSTIQFVNLGPLEYERAKTIFNKAKHPGFVGRELFFRCASTGIACVAILDDQDVGVALIAKQKLQALSVIVSAQGKGIGQALMRRLRPEWVSAIADRIGFFEKLGYKSFGAPKVGANGKHATQLMQAIANWQDSSEPQAPHVELSSEPQAPHVELSSEPQAPPDEQPTILDLLDDPGLREATGTERAQLNLLNTLYQKAQASDKYDSALKILDQAQQVIRRMRGGR